MSTNDCSRECQNTGLTWSRQSSDPCAVKERYARSEGVAENYIFDLTKYRNNALQICNNNERCKLQEGHDQAIIDRINDENNLKRLNNLSSKCTDNKYQKPQYLGSNSFLLSNENRLNCRIPPKLNIFNN